MSSFLSPDTVTSEEKGFVEMQECLLRMCNENFEEEMAKIWESKYVHDALRLKLLIDCLLCLSEYRTRSVPLFVRLLKSFSDRVRDEICLVELPEMLLGKFASPLELSNSKCFFLLHCLHIGLFSKEDLVASFRSYYDTDCRLPTQWMAMLAWFGNVIEEVDHVFYADCVNQYINIFRHTFADKSHKDFVAQFDELVASNWLHLSGAALSGLSNNPIVQVLANDDADSLDQLFHERQIDINMHIGQSILEIHDIFQNEPTLIQIAAFYGKQCFDYLRRRGASLARTDKAGRTLMQFAAAGNNTAVVQYLEDIGTDVTGAMHAAALYHQNDMFEYFFAKNRYAIDAIVPPYGSVMHCCAAADNAKIMLFCFENGADVNSREPGGVSSFLTGRQYTLLSKRATLMRYVFC